MTAAGTFANYRKAVQLFLPSPAFTDNHTFHAKIENISSHSQSGNTHNQSFAIRSVNIHCTAVQCICHDASSASTLTLQAR